MDIKRMYGIMVEYRIINIFIISLKNFDKLG